MNRQAVEDHQGGTPSSASVQRRRICPLRLNCQRRVASSKGSAGRILSNARRRQTLAPPGKQHAIHDLRCEAAFVNSLALALTTLDFLTRRTNESPWACCYARCR